MKHFRVVGVAMGGLSREREISLKSGLAVKRSLEALGFETVVLDPKESGWHRPLLEGRVDVVFNVIHGHPGEDGVLQGFLDLLQIPYTGSGVLGSALAMDKLQSKRIWQSCGLPTPPWVGLHQERDLGRALSELGLPLMVKPVAEGSSIGMAKIESEEALARHWQAAKEMTLFAERWIEGEEYTAAFVGDRWFPLIRIETKRPFFDYEAKYFASDTKYIVPSGLPAEKEQKLQELAQAAVSALGVEGWGRVDFLLDGEGRPWLLEINTVPGMTSSSLVPKAAEAGGINFHQLIEMILTTVSV